MFESIVAWYAPHVCIGCSREGKLLCGDCQTRLPRAAERCYRCRALSDGGRTCKACRRTSKLSAVQVACTYEGLSKDLVQHLKFGGARAAANYMASELTTHLPLVDDSPLYVPVPTATSRRRQRGFDQSALIARALLRQQPDIEVASLLGRSGQTRQVGSSRKLRLSQLVYCFFVRGNADRLAGRHVVLIDDVMTTGATLEAAAAVLREAGAKRVTAIVFARA